MEEFVPAPNYMQQSANAGTQQQNVPRAVDTMVARDPNHAAQLALAQEVMSQPSFTELMQRSTAIEVRYRGMPGKVDNEEGFRAVSEVFAEAKDIYNTAEEMRKTAVAFPDKYVRMVNKLMKETIKDPMTNIRNATGARRDAYLDKLRKEAERDRQANGEGDVQGVEGVPAQGVTELGDGGEPRETQPELPIGTTKTDHGTVHQRETTTVTVENAIDVLKAIVSTSKINEMYTAGLIEFKQGALNEMVKANPRKSKWPGLKVDKVKKSV